MNSEDFGYVVKNNMCLFQKGPFSQWYGAFGGQKGGFKLEGIYYNCAEQSMMAGKAALFRDEETFKEVIAEKNPKRQKALGRKVKNFDSDVWDEIKYELVFASNVMKFSQNKEISDFLVSFHECTIFCESSPWDTVWGNGLDIDDPDSLDIYKWKGQNLLGKIIGEIRKNITK